MRSRLPHARDRDTSAAHARRDRHRGGAGGPRRRPRPGGAPAARSTVVEARDRIGGRVWVQRGALAGLDLDMGGAWVADCQPHVWSEADRYGVAREHDALPASVRWRMGDAVVERSLPVDVEDLGELERAVAALLAAARRHDATRPPDAQGLEDLDVPAAAPGSRRSGCRGACASCCCSGSPPARRAEPDDASLLEYLRWISARRPPALGAPGGGRARLALPGRDRGAVRGDRRRRPRERSRWATPVARDRGGRRRRARGDRRRASGGRAASS